MFDHGGNKTVDVREVGTILRSLGRCWKIGIIQIEWDITSVNFVYLGCCPTEAEIQEILVKVEDHETSSVHLARFLPVVTQIITEHKYGKF